MDQIIEKGEDLVQVENLSLTIDGKRLLKQLSFSLPKNKITAIVGESGSGKSLTALSLLGLLPRSKTLFTKGKIWFEGVDILRYSEKQWQELRKTALGMVFQEPQSSLNPSMRCGEQVAEAYHLYAPKENDKKKRFGKKYFLVSKKFNCRTPKGFMRPIRINSVEDKNNGS